MNKTRPKWDALTNLIYMTGVPVGFYLMNRLTNTSLPNFVALLLGIAGIIAWWLILFALLAKFRSGHSKRFAQENAQLVKAYHETKEAQAFYDGLINRGSNPRPRERSWSITSTCPRP